MSSQIVITGGAGFIGSAVVDYLTKSGHHLTVIDNFSTGNASLPKTARVFKANINDLDVLHQVFSSSVDVLIHLAALTDATESVNHPEKYFQVNYHDSGTLIKSAVAHGIKNFIFSSTAAVYTNSKEAVTEISPTKPANVYGQTKAMTEDELYRYTRNYSDVNAIIFRFFNAAGADSLRTKPSRGPRIDTSNQSIFANLFKVVVDKSNQFVLYGNSFATKDGSALRDYIHVDDIAAAITNAVELMTSTSVGYEVMNLGSENGFTNLEVIDATRRVTNHPIPIKVKPAREGEIAFSLADSSKARQLLEWAPQRSDLDSIIKTTWKWVQQENN